ncbi:MAG: hypothetical protein ACK46Y_14750 [Fluviicola sp.]
MGKLRHISVLIGALFLFSCDDSTDKVYYLQFDSIDILSPKIKVFSEKKYVGIVEEIKLVKTKPQLKIKVFKEFQIAKKHTCILTNRNLLEKIIVIENLSNTTYDYGSTISHNQKLGFSMNTIELDSALNHPKVKELFKVLKIIDSLNIK